MIICVLTPISSEQGIETSKLNNDSKFLSNAKQLLVYVVISNSSVTSGTQPLDTLSLAATTIQSVNSESDSTATPEFSGTFDGFKADTFPEDTDQLNSKVKLQQ